MGEARRERDGWRKRWKVALTLFASLVTLILGAIAPAAAQAYTVTVSVSGEGGGTITADTAPPIDCNKAETPPHDQCFGEKGAFLTTTLHAAPDLGSILTSWTVLRGGEPDNSCTNPAADCVVSSSSKNFEITANFEKLAPPPEVEFPAVEPPPLEAVELTPEEDEGAISGYEAAFHGRANPKDDPTKFDPLVACRFEYLTKAAYEGNLAEAKDGFSGATQLQCDPSAAEIGEVDEFVDVGATAKGLQPNTEYRVRLLAEKAASEPKAATGKAPTYTAPPVPFAIPAIAPAVLTGKAWSITDTTATLAAAVNPHNSAIIDCHFEYGTDESYGQVAPCDSGPGAGNEAVQVTADISNLDPSTSYHFRLVADNGTGGPQQGPDAAFATRPPILFPQRGYELVSAFNTNGIDVYPDLSAPDGNHYAYSIFVLPVPGSQTGAFTANFRASRNPDGSWADEYVGQPHPGPGESGFLNPAPLFSAEDLSRVAWGSFTSIDPDDRNGASDAYLRDMSNGGSLTWLSRDPAIAPGSPQSAGGGAGGVQYVSADGGRVYFTSARRLLPEDVATGSNRSLYEWHNGQLSLTSIQPGSSEGFATESALGSKNNEKGNTSGNEPVLTRNAVSVDGRRVAFESGLVSSTPQERQRLYVRVDGESTVEASAAAPGAPALPACAGPPSSTPTPPCDVNYWGADQGIESVYFTSTSPLTPDSTAVDGSSELFGAGDGPDLYRYSVPPDGDLAGGHLVDLTPTASGGGGVMHVLSVSDDGRRVYFLANAALAPGASPGSCARDIPGAGGFLAGTCNLYLAQLDGPEDDTPAISLIARGRVPLGVGGDGKTSSNEKVREAVANPDGSVLAFRSAEALVPGRQTGGKLQVYVYEVGDALSCASCPPDGTAPAAYADLTPVLSTGEDLGYEGQINRDVPHVRNVSADGAVFFQTKSALLPADTGGTESVYEWRGGRLNLISAGDDPSDAIFGDATEGNSTQSGATVFFASAGAYVPGVPGGVTRIYAARVGGGFTPPLGRPPCTGEDCKPVATPQPNYAAPSTGTIQGRGNVVERPARCAKGKVRRKGRCVARKQRKRAKRNHGRAAR